MCKPNLFFLTAATVLLSVAATFGASWADTVILIENATIINPASSRNEVLDGFVLIRDESIEYVGRKRPKVPKTIKTIDGRGKFVIPGLIDSHVHLANIAGLNFKFSRKYPELAESYYRQLNRSYLYFGYTTLIDLNNHSPKIVASLMKQEVRPEILTCGAQLEVWNGFMMTDYEPEERLTEFPNFVIDRYNEKVRLPKVDSPESHTAEASVRKIVREQNAVCAKFAYEDGFGGTEDVTWEMPTPEITREIAAETRRVKIPLMLHASSYTAQRFAVDNGIDIIAHGMWHWGAVKDYLNVNELPEPHRNLLRTIAAQGIGFQPTFRVLAGQRDVFVDEFINDQHLAAVYPKEFLAWLRSGEGSWQRDNIKKYGKGIFDEMPDSEIAALFQRFVDKIALSSRFLADDSGRLLFGSDTPSSNSHANPPGYNGFLEMREWSKAGIPLGKILRAATIDNAKAFNIDRSFGSIEKGKISNLLILSRNPLSDVTAYDSIETVFIRGKHYARRDLSAETRNAETRNAETRNAETRTK